jgi:catechol 2,3-dioxygenase-like lactoylglutathione lyase family enzyme
MKPHISAVTLAVKDLARAKEFYGKGLGWAINHDYPTWVSFNLDDGNSMLGLYPREGLANDAGVSAEGSGFSGVVLSYLVRAEDRVAEVLNEAKRAGATIVKPAEQAQWGGMSGVFADPDGYLWKVASGSGPQPYAE